MPPQSPNGAIESGKHTSTGWIIRPDSSDSDGGLDRAHARQHLRRGNAGAGKKLCHLGTDIRHVRQRLKLVWFHLVVGRLISLVLSGLACVSFNDGLVSKLCRFEILVLIVIVIVIEYGYGYGNGNDAGHSDWGQLSR